MYSKYHGRLLRNLKNTNCIDTKFLEYQINIAFDNRLKHFFNDKFLDLFFQPPLSRLTI